MDEPEGRTWPVAVETSSRWPTVPVPTSISDVLYLIATQQADIASPDILRKLDHAHIYLIRGDLVPALRSVDAVLDELQEQHPAYADVVALRIFLLSMIDQDSDSWRSNAADRANIGSGSPHIVALCAESNEQWHSGNLFGGLSLNQKAIQKSQNGAAIWRLYTDLLLVKKLTDIHVSHQAFTMIRKMVDLVDNSGFHAFESLMDALRANLHLQAGHFDEALHSATKALSVAELRAGTVGVKLALSVSATAALGLGDADEAAAYLKEFHSEPTRYVLPDSVARAALAEVALIAADSGPRAAAERIRADWHLLATRSGCFIEDLTRPAWLVTIARRAGDTALAQRALDAVESLRRNNRGVPPLETAAGHARSAFGGERPGLPSILDLNSAVPPPRAKLASAQRVPPPEPAPQAVGSADDPSARLPLLSQREDEIARLVARGMTNQQVANELGLSPHTVNFHLRGIFRKLSISTRVKLGQLIAELDRQRDRLVMPDRRP